LQAASLAPSLCTCPQLPEGDYTGEPAKDPWLQQRPDPSWCRRGFAIRLTDRERRVRYQNLEVQTATIRLRKSRFNAGVAARRTARPSSAMAFMLIENVRSAECTDEHKRHGRIPQPKWPIRAPLGKRSSNRLTLQVIG